MVDYHIHTDLSDGKDVHSDILKKAYEAGLKEIGFSDHFCLYFPNWALKESDYGLMIKRVSDCQKNTNQFLNVKFGLEVDYIEGKEEEIKRELSAFPLDYVIGSVHYIDGWNFDTNIKDYTHKNIDLFYKNYFSLVQKAAQSALFDIMGHADLAKKFNYHPSFDLNSLYEETAKIFAKSDVAIEINTSGKDKMCKEFYPSDQLIQHCFNYNVPVTLGSDSHKKEDIARYFDDATRKIKKAGYQKIAVFKNRQRSFISI